MGKGACGRSACYLDPGRIKKRAGADVWIDEQLWQPNYNATPTTKQPVLYLNEHGERVLRSMTWGT